MRARANAGSHGASPSKHLPRFRITQGHLERRCSSRECHEREGGGSAWPIATIKERFPVGSEWPAGREECESARAGTIVLSSAGQAARIL